MYARIFWNRQTFWSENSIEIMKLVTSQDVDLTFRKTGDHRLSEKGDLDVLCDTVDTAIKIIDL